MIPQDEGKVTGRVHVVAEVKVSVSRRDFRTLMLVHRRLKDIYDEARFATPSEVGALVDLMSEALPNTSAALWSILNSPKGTVTYVGEDEAFEDEELRYTPE